MSQRSKFTYRRIAARVLPLDESDRVLLLHGFDPARPDAPFWFTIGGGVDGDETPAEAAGREMREEVGIEVDPAALGEPIAEGFAEFSFNGWTMAQDQLFFAVRANRTAVTFDAMDPLERATTDSHRWWSADELEATGETYHPADLPDLVRRAARHLASGQPSPGR